MLEVFNHYFYGRVHCGRQFTPLSEIKNLVGKSYFKRRQRLAEYVAGLVRVHGITAEAASMRVENMRPARAASKTGVQQAVHVVGKWNMTV